MDSASSFGTIVSFCIKIYVRSKATECVSYIKVNDCVKCRGKPYPEKISHSTVFNKTDFSNGFSFTSGVLCRICHVLAVRRLRWRPKRDFDDSSCLQLSSCGLDHSVRIFNMAVLA